VAARARCDTWPLTKRSAVVVSMVEEVETEVGEAR
jgi:hypothetical protein